MNRHQRRTKLKSKQAHHKIIAASAYEFAAAYYEDIMRNMSKQLNTDEYKKAKELYPTAESYAGMMWDNEYFIAEATKTLASMLGRSDVPEIQKEQIAEAIMLNQVIPGQKENRFTIH